MQPDTRIINLDINLIIPNKYQPRKVFNEAELASLSESIKTYGIINPILVRQKDDKYEIIAGERRFRAAKQIGLTQVPVIIKTANEQQMAELALIENIQRQGLSPIEEAKSYEEIMRIGNQTQSSLATKLGKSQSAIANKMRLLSLPEEIQNALAKKEISERHARSLLKVEDKSQQLILLERIVTEKLTVKETDNIINEKELTEEEIQNAINDIMKSLNIAEEEIQKEEKEDDNMNNGNFFPNFDNNAMNNNTSLNMMNMQSMNQMPMAQEPETVMPTAQPVAPETQLVVPQQPTLEPVNNLQPAMDFGQFGQAPAFNQNMNTNPGFNPMEGFMTPVMEAPLFNQPLPATGMPSQPVAPDMTTMNSPMQDVPLFNPNVTMPSMGTMPEPPVLTVPDIPMAPEPSFEIPVTNPTPVITPQVDKLTELQKLLSNNGFSYKVYSNETDNCIIIELPKN